LVRRNQRAPAGRLFRVVSRIDSMLRVKYSDAEGDATMVQVWLILKGRQPYLVV
jgi:hypothetical protein